MRNLFLFVMILTAVALTGCDKKLQTIKVTGTVTYEGAPLAGASVNFAPASEGEGHPAYGTTDSNGNYTLQTPQGGVDAGTTPGKYLVTIRKREQLQSAESSGEYDGTSTTSDPNAPPPKSLIPVRYERTATSELTATVDKDNTVHNFDLTN